MALILVVLIIFTVSSFEFHQVNDFIANDEWPQFIPPQSTKLTRFGAMLESYHMLQSKPKTVLESKDALKLIWSALLEKAIDNAVKDYRKPLQVLCQPTVDILNIYCDNSYNKY